MVKICAMVKDEVDIVDDWVNYHGNIFGYNNICVIDNYSSDGTFEKLLKYKGKIMLYRLPNYKDKGNYMTSFMNKFCKNDIFIPLDIDELIVCYNKNTNTISCENGDFHKIINTLPNIGFYKMNYIQSMILDENGYETISDVKWGNYDDYGNFAKTFFNTRFFKGQIDHGNHYLSNNYFLSNFCLVHYHCRSINQITKKIYNNVHGLGYDVSNLHELTSILQKNPQCPGYHHIKNQINVLNNTYKLPIQSILPNSISLEPIRQKLNNIGMV